MRRLLVTCAGLMLARAAVAAPVPVTTCGQIVETGRAELVQDLSCGPSASTAAVVMDRGGRLALNGFTLTVSGTTAIYCASSCRITGPGTISGGFSGVLHRGASARTTERRSGPPS